MRRTAFVVTCVLMLAVYMAPCAWAGYQISTRVEAVAQGWQYTWDVYNIDQGTGTGDQWADGFDGLFILVPVETQVLSAVVPDRAYPGVSYWTFVDNYPSSSTPAGMKWLRFWGTQVGCLYHAGETATCSVVTGSNTVPGATELVAVTHWYPPPSYADFFFVGTGPVAVPEPSSIFALLCGVGGLASRRKRR